MPAILTTEQVATFDRQGWLVLPDLVTPAACAHLVARAEQLMAGVDPDGHRSTAAGPR